MQWELEGKRVLVTGASTGIGAALVHAFAEVGAEVAVHYNSSRDAAETVAEAARGVGVRAVTLQADLLERSAPATLVGEAVDALGGMDVLVNNAGGLVGRQLLSEMSDDFLERVTELNYHSMVRACRAALPHLPRPGGAIVNVTSVAARNGGGHGSTAYAASKAAVSGFTRALAKELAAEGVRVNALSPGTIDTPFHEQHTSPEAMARTVGSIPFGRVGTARECAGTVLWLASPTTGGYVTGQVVEVNGGQLLS